jgi:hypothetical protein
MTPKHSFELKYVCRIADAVTLNVCLAGSKQLQLVQQEALLLLLEATIHHSCH